MEWILSVNIHSLDNNYNKKFNIVEEYYFEDLFIDINFLKLSGE